MGLELKSDLEVRADEVGDSGGFFADLGTAERHIDGLVAWCKSALDRGDTDQALRVSDRAVRLAKDNAHLKILRGTTLLTAGLALEALASFLEAISLGGSPDGEIGLVYAYLALGDLEAAADAVRSLLTEYAVRDFPGIAPAARQVCRAMKNKTAGWASLAPDGRLVGEIDLDRLDGGARFTACGSTSGQIFFDKTAVEIISQVPLSPVDNFSSFSCLMPSVDLSEPIDVSVGGGALLGSPGAVPSSFKIEGFVETSGSKISGWAWLPRYPSARLSIRVIDPNGNAKEFETTPGLESAPANGQAISGYAPQHFSVGLPEGDTTGPPIEVWAWLPGSGLEGQLAGSPIGPAKTEIAIRAGKPDFARSVSNGTACALDVIIPVYEGVHETLACLQSVIATLRVLGDSAVRSEIVVIDDASPNTELVEALAPLAADGTITLLRNDRNLGFPASVNRGFTLHPDRDVIILNSDTVVFGDWLLRLREAAYGQLDIGTVTPLSNEASILSYPNCTGGNPVPADEEAAALDEVARHVNVGLTVEIPTAVGFCTYIRRDCLDGTGLFDIASFGRGYGEENDFCMRARAMGWRHVVAPNVFVSHIGGRSFGASKEALVARNVRILNELHPGYDALVEDFIEVDPLARARRNIDIARLCTNLKSPASLLITLGLPGGVARYVAGSAKHHLENGRTALVLQPYKPAGGGRRRCILRAPLDETLVNLIYDLPDELDGLLELLSTCTVDAVEIHHFLGHDPGVLSIPDRLGLPYELVVHDYSWICPRITLMDGRGRYCGMPADARICDRCVAIDGGELNEDIRVQNLRDRSGGIFAGASRVVAACNDVVERLRSFFPTALYEVMPWEELHLAGAPVAQSPVQGRIRVAVIGAIGQQKGYDLLLACARDAALRDLPIEFVVIGYTQDDLALFKTGRVFVTGRYEDAEAVDLIRAQACHFAFLPSVSPETWSFALTLAWEAGLPVLAFDLGAISERIRSTGYGWIIPFSADERTINVALLRLADEFRRPEIIKAPNNEAKILNKVETANIVNVPRHRARSCEGMDQTQDKNIAGLQSKGTLLPLSPGIYSFSLGNVARPARVGGILLPAVQIVLANSQPSDAKVDFLGRNDLDGNWLIEKGDVLVVRVTGAVCTFLVNTFRTVGQDFSLMPVECRRLDQPESAGNAAAPSGGRRILRTQITAHVQNRGDLPFVGLDWAGCLGQRLWIEAFTINPLEGIAPEDIEYKAITANGWETPWIPGGNICGTRGAATPITGFAIRLRGAGMQSYECEYKGAFFTAGIVGPMRNGGACKAGNMKDPLEGIQLTIIEKSQPPVANSGSASSILEKNFELLDGDK